MNFVQSSEPSELSKARIKNPENLFFQKIKYSFSVTSGK